MPKRQKQKIINLINHTSGFDYNNFINTEAWEDTQLIWTKRDMAGIYTLYSNPIIITTFIRIWNVVLTLVDEGSG